ncbi:MAG: hypothetical protein A2511_09605 [Deltaproteobacteria bacterium RIFOXYD12_FULL_50_9]|nr:MAG: hypothetical protein A2511_09605 [Deltaproteobacteria bacterium RIFOXYD12_FULL_50_9]
MPYIFKKYLPVRSIVFVAGEGIILFLAIIIATCFYEGAEGFLANADLFILRACLVVVACQVCLYYFDLYDLARSVTVTDTITRATQAIGFACIALALIYYLFPVTIIAMKVLLVGYGIVCLSIGLWRFFYAIVLARKMFTQAILIIGDGELAEKIAHEIEDREDSGFKIVAYAGENNPLYNPRNVPCLADWVGLCRGVNELGVDKVVVALDDKRGKMPVRELLECRVSGLSVIKGIEFYEELSGKIIVEKTNPSWLIFSAGFNKNRLFLVVKRFVDIFVSVTGLLVALPVMLLTAICIKLDSPGPVFYSQERVGENNKKFKVFKFRSMKVDAESNGAVWAKKDDDRVTRVGQFIRKARIDETPQMWTVLRGDMSFVGPRPERPVFVEQLAQKIPYYALRHTVKPGITGWAQVWYPYGASEEDALRKLEYDLYYIKNMTVWMDLVIILQTIKIVLFQKGAR